MGQELKRKTTVIGHRNPDTDSICSAICYANLKRLVTGDEYIPGRAGHVNGETQFGGKHFPEDGLEDHAGEQCGDHPFRSGGRGARGPDHGGRHHQNVHEHL